MNSPLITKQFQKQKYVKKMKKEMSKEMERVMMKELKTKAFLLVFLIGVLLTIDVFSASAFGQCDEHNYYWVAGSGNWSTPQNWSHQVWDPDLGKCVPVPGVPGSADTVEVYNGGTAEISSSANAELVFIGAGSNLSVVAGLLAITDGLHVDWYGRLEQSGGQTSATYEIVGFEGAGTVIQTGGIHNVVEGFNLGFDVGGDGTYELSGSGELSTDWINVGYEGTGTFIQSGGRNIIHTSLGVGNRTGSNGTYELHDGELVANTVWLGGYGSGIFVQSGGNVNINDGLFIGPNPTSNGKYKLHGGTLNVGYGIYVGGEAGSVGEYELSNGTLVADEIFVGRSGTGTFVQSGGNVTVNDGLLIGQNPGGEGIYKLHGGTIDVGYGVSVGGEGIGSFDMDGGTINATNDDADLTVFGGTGSLTGPGTFNIEVGYLSEEIYGAGGDKSVDVIFERYCLFNGGAYNVNRIRPDEFGGCTWEDLIPSSVFDVSFGGNFSVWFTIAIPYDAAEVAALNADEMSLRAVHKDVYGTYELLEDVQIDTTEKIVYGQARSFGKFALFAEGTGSEAAKLAKDVIGGPYLGDGVTWGGKGFNCWRCPPTRFVDPNDIKTSGYCYYDARIGECNQDAAPGVDCSGLIFWAYNKAFGAVTYQETEAPYNIIHYENADGQYRHNSTPIAESELMPGDLLFFNTDSDPYIEHVEMYVGPFFYPGGSIKGTYYPAGLYNIVSARGNNYGIIPDCLSERTQPGNGFVGFRRVTPLPWVGGTAFVQCPVDIILTDPDGFTITKDIWEVPGVLYYSVFDIDKDGDLDDMVTIVERKIGDYLITVVPEPDASPTDTYTLGVNFDGQTLILAENVSIDDIPDEPYIIRSTGIIPIIPETIDFDPDTLNLKSKGNWITCYIELPEGYDVDDIDVGSILLEHLLEVQHSDVQDDVLMVKFDRKDVIAYIELVLEIELPADVTLMVTGELTDGTPFEGSDTIRVIEEGGKK